MTEDHFDLELQDLLDGRLDPAERARVQTHVDGCARCQAELEDLRRGRELARRGFASADLPPGLLDDLLKRIDAATPRARNAALGRRRFLAFAAGTAAAGLLAVVYIRGRRDLPSEAIEAYRAFQAGHRSLALTTSDPAALERFFQTHLTFHVRVFDLGMMNYRLIGGRTDQLGGGETAWYVYEGPQNRRLLCQMFRGSLSELPTPSERRDRNGVTFFIYARAAHTAVFWAEADVLCVVVSDMPAEDTIALAFAKAMKA